MSEAVNVSILIVSYNTREETLACLASVYEQTRRSSFEVILVDNASSDGSADAIAEQFPQVKLFALKDNLGFAGANNLAATHAAGEYLLLLNPDTVILDQAIDTIVEFAGENRGAGIYGGRTYFADMSLNHNSCHGAPTPWSLLCMGTGLSSVFRRSAWLDPESLGRWQRDTVRQVDCITGCFLLIGRSLWERLGGFDLDFFMYGEDTDLCLRAKKEGFACLVCPEARLIHYGGRSEKVRGDKMVRLFRAKRQLFQKHWRPGLARFGSTMLATWALSRYGALTLLGLGSKRCRDGAKEWHAVYQNRQAYSSV